MAENFYGALQINWKFEICSTKIARNTNSNMLHQHLTSKSSLFWDTL